jgi:hypothetical protein
MIQPMRQRQAQEMPRINGIDKILAVEMQAVVYKETSQPGYLTFSGGEKSSIGLLSVPQLFSGTR